MKKDVLAEVVEDAGNKILGGLHSVSSALQDDEPHNSVAGGLYEIARALYALTDMFGQVLASPEVGAALRSIAEK